MIKVKREFNNGLFDCQEIYSDTGMKILETTNGILWNNSKEFPIGICKARRDDYTETNQPIDEEEIENAID